MISALVWSSNGLGAPPLVDDLGAVGIRVVGALDPVQMLQDVIRTAPDLIIMYENHPDEALFESTAAINAKAPRPVVMFTLDPDAEKIALATRSGVHAYVVNGYSQKRLRSVIHLAQARFRHEQTLRQDLLEVQRKFAERKLVDRAKGILMGNRQLREEEAFRALRSAAMHSKQRIGQVAQVVIDAARYAEAINRAGQLRMLSQRLVKLYALGCAGIRPAETAGLFADSLAQVDDHLATLSRTLSAPTFGDLVIAVSAPWQALRTALAAPARAGLLPDIDRLAEDMLARAEQLTANLEVAGLAAALHVINVSGRQRMLSQRLAKAAMMRLLLDGTAAGAADQAVAATKTEMLAGLEYLNDLPLSNAVIAGEVGAAMASWAAFEAALNSLATAASRDALAILSEVLLGHFDRLTDQLERGMQALV